MPIRKDNVLSDGLVTQQGFPVSSYGASPNTGTDQTLYIQAALNAANAAGGGRVEFNQSGTYIVTGILTSGGASPTAPNTTLNSALVIYSNTEIRCVPGVEIKLGLVKDDSKCYMIRNANPTATAYNQNITIDGGFWNGGGIIEESTIVDGTHIKIPNDYASRLGNGVVFTVSSSAGKVSFTSTGASYSAGFTTVTVASSTNGAGGFQSSWQAGNTQNPTITGRTIGAPGVLVVSGDYTAYAGIGSTCYVTGNSGATANTTTGYVVASAVYSAGSTTITMTGALEGTTVADGKVVFNYNQLWYQDGALFMHIENLKIRNTKSGGWDKYSWWLVDCNRFVFSDNQFNNGSDGFHIGGLCKNGVVRSTSGRCLDNMIPLVSNELWYRPALYATTCGAISNILIDGFFCDSSIGTCLEPVRLTGKTYGITDCTIKGGRGTVGSGYAIRLGDDLAATYGNLAGTPMSRILIEDIKMTVPSGYASVDISGSGVSSVTIRNLHVLAATNKAVYVHTPTGQLQNQNTNLDSLILDGIVSEVGTTDKLIQIDAFVKEFLMSNCTLKCDVNGQGFFINNIAAVTGPTPPALYAEGQVYNGSMTNCHFVSTGTGGASPFVNFANTEGTGLIPTRMQMQGCTFRSTNANASTGIQVLGIVNLSLTDCFFDLAASSSPIYVNGANAWLRLMGKNVRVIIGNNWVQGTSTPASNPQTGSTATKFTYNGGSTRGLISGGSGKVNIIHPDFPVDMSQTAFTGLINANANEGDVFFNTALFAATSTGAPGQGTMQYVCESSPTVPGTGFWELVNDPKPQTTAAGVTLSPYHSKLTLVVTSAATIVLPPAKLGMTFTFHNDSAGAVVLDGDASETLNNTAGINTYSTTVSNSTRGSVATYKCVTAGKWNLVAGSW